MTVTQRSHLLPLLIAFQPMKNVSAPSPLHIQIYICTYAINFLFILSFVSLYVQLERGRYAQFFKKCVPYNNSQNYTFVWGFWS